MTQKKSSSGKSGKKPALSSESASAPAGNNPPAATPKADTRNTATTAKATTANASGTKSDSASGGWIAPVALLFGLLGTGFSAYLWSQLKNLGESTSVQLQSQAESAKTDVAGVKTELDEKTASLSTALDEKSTALTATLDERTTALTATLDEKTSALNAALEEKSAALTSALEEKTSALSTALEEKSTELSTALEERTTALDEKVVSVSETLREEANGNKVEIATTTATAVQELTSKTEQEINNVSTSFNTGLALQRERSTEQYSTLDQRLNELDESVQTTNELASRGQRDWVLAEVNYLLRTGVHRVRLAGDVKAGVIALESASDRLHTLGDIDYLPVREQIAEEVAALRRVGPPDIEGLIFKLEQMSKRADSLPLPPSEMDKARQALKEDPAAASASVAKSLLDRLNFSFEVSESGEPGKPRSSRKAKPTKDQLTASESLRLHLQAARLSALRHDAESFTNHMDNAISYSEQIFDQEDDRVTTFIADLISIRETSIVPKVPALGSSLSLFTKIDSKRGTE
ncbi:MAG: uroporphyrinogen-III C-methyltransferase [Gammaproteobacteria bacterium]|nr:uroporphyrinogen-III C-methyltransferase [Gammaproteobacteria bacterium]